MFDPLPHHLATCNMYTVFSSIISNPPEPSIDPGVLKNGMVGFQKFNNPDHIEIPIMTMGVGRVVLIMFAFVWRLPPGREYIF